MIGSPDNQSQLTMDSISILGFTRTQKWKLMKFTSLRSHEGGGGGGVVLCALLSEIKINITLVHCNGLLVLIN